MFLSGKGQFPITSHRLSMRPQIAQVKRHLTHATSHDRISISKKSFGPVAFFETTHSENRVDITGLVSTYNAFVWCDQMMWPIEN